jgi:hypothetical protein
MTRSMTDLSRSIKKGNSDWKPPVAERTEQFDPQNNSVIIPLHRYFIGVRKTFLLSIRVSRRYNDEFRTYIRSAYDSTMSEFSVSFQRPTRIQVPECHSIIEDALASTHRMFPIVTLEYDETVFEDVGVGLDMSVFTTNIRMKLS